VSKLQIRRVGYALGAEVTGLDLREPIGASAIAEIRAAWLEHIVLCFPGQDLEAEHLSSFANLFGELDDNRALPHLRHPDHPAVYVIVNKPLVIKGKSYSGGAASQWHTDLSYTSRPGTAGFLIAKELPDVGGNTMFANMYLAYEHLSPTLQRMIDPLEGIHDITTGATYLKGDPPAIQAEKRRLNPPVAHPVVRVHPEAGRKALFLGENVRQFAGMTEEESRPLIAYLNSHATRHEFVYRHSWRANDLVMWDNRCALHYAVLDYDPGQLRRLLRCSLLGPKTGRVCAGGEVASNQP
jgi:taurine dioxygenase